MDKDERIKELEKVAMELFDMVHDGNLIELKIRANDLYDIIVKKWFIHVVGIIVLMCANGLCKIWSANHNTWLNA